MAIERYVSVCHPMSQPGENTGVMSILGLIFFSFAFNICRFLEFETTYDVAVSRLYENVYV